MCIRDRFSLKEQFAKDKLSLIPKADGLDGILEYLNSRNIAFKKKEERISIPLEQTMSALPIVEGVRGLLEGFEVIQGTMDDVFLNATRKEQEYA